MTAGLCELSVLYCTSQDARNLPPPNVTLNVNSSAMLAWNLRHWLLVKLDVSVESALCVVAAMVLFGGDVDGLGLERFRCSRRVEQEASRLTYEFRVPIRRLSRAQLYRRTDVKMAECLDHLAHERSESDKWKRMEGHIFLTSHQRLPRRIPSIQPNIRPINIQRIVLHKKRHNPRNLMRLRELP